ncbi:MAG: endonuclease/exonuclease/phosphatase family protein [Bacteroidota bacterium]
MQRLLLISLILFIISCSEDANDPIVIQTPPLSISFDQSSIEIEEMDITTSINISFESAAPSDGTILVLVSNSTAVLDEDITISPTPVDNVITLPYSSQDDGIVFSITPLMDDDGDMEEIRFSLLGREGISIGAIREVTVSIVDPDNNGGGTNGGFEVCISEYEPNELNVATWNIRQFPDEGNATVAAVVDILENFDVDLIGVQEITSRSQFEALTNGIDGWEATASNVNGGLDIGYIYKASEVSIIENPTLLFTGDTQPFPREVVQMKIRHSSGLEVVVMNLHLKCCSDGNSPARRADASAKIQDYIDSNLPNEEVIVLGDFNDEITGTGPFQNFIDDPNYAFADQEIADGSSAFWSFPSFPSHIDHILITDELFDNLISAETIRLNTCVTNYSNIVSDHRPVVASFSTD